MAAAVSTIAVVARGRASATRPIRGGVASSSHTPRRQGTMGSSARQPSSALRRPSWASRSSATRRHFFGTEARPSPVAASLFRLLQNDWEALAVLPEHERQELTKELKARLDALAAADLGISQGDMDLIGTPPGVGYQNIYDGPEMTVCIFLLRKGARLPLHDHPGMYVYGRLLFGRMRLLSFDLEPAATAVVSHRERAGPQRGFFRKDVVLGPDPVSYSLGPKEGNLHELRALEDCAFFDVLTPPYQSHLGRDCTYYRCQPEGDDGQYLFVPSQPPDNFYVESMRYKGPPLSLL